MKKIMIVLALAANLFADTHIDELQKACDGGDAAGCALLGVRYEEGEGVKQNKSKAKELYGKACDMKLQLGCEEYKRLNEAGY